VLVGEAQAFKGSRERERKTAGCEDGGRNMRWIVRCSDPTNNLVCVCATVGLSLVVNIIILVYPFAFHLSCVVQGVKE
jgi:hypothetical protein